MRVFTQKTTAPPTLNVALTYDDRKRSRLKVTLNNGEEAGILLERGEHMHHGDRLVDAESGAVVEILAAPEKLIEVNANTPLLFARAAYHLGNRHVPVQIIPQPDGGQLLFQVDHVLADMVRGLGCTVREVGVGFQPEHGAYGGGHHHHDHDDEADHAHDHDHEHSRDDDNHYHHAHDPGHGPHRSVPKIHEFKS